MLVTVANNAGTLNTIGSLGVSPLTDELGLDISGTSGVAYASLQSGPNSVLYTIDLGTGLATSVGQITSGNLIRDLTVVPEPTTAAVLGLGGLALLRRRRALTNGKKCLGVFPAWVPQSTGRVTDDLTRAAHSVRTAFRLPPTRSLRCVGGRIAGRDSVGRSGRTAGRAFAWTSAHRSIGPADLRRGSGVFRAQPRPRSKHPSSSPYSTVPE